MFFSEEKTKTSKATFTATIAAMTREAINGTLSNIP